jgi:hypothetical protein
MYNELMLLTNHVMTGTLLGLTIDNPVVLAPTAVASHLALDMTPHFGLGGPKPDTPNFRSRAFIVLGAMDFLASMVVVTAACVIWPHRVVNILVGAIGAALPDLTYIPVLVFGDLIYKIPFYRPMIRFLARIQWYERPPGLITEILWATLMLWLLAVQMP